MARQSSQPADGTGAAYAGEAFGGPGATPPASVGLLARLKGYLAWANYQILGAVMGAPLTLKLLVQLVLRCGGRVGGAVGCTWIGGAGGC